MQNRGPQLEAVTIAFLTFSTLCAALRIYVRLRLTKFFGYDDYLLVAAGILYVVYCSFVLSGIHYGTGQHIASLSLSRFSSAMKMWYFCEIFYALSSTMIKLAAGTLLLRVTTARVHIWIIWTILALSAAFGTVFTLLLLFQCTPIHFFWTSILDPKAGGHCFSPSTVTGLIYAHAAVNSVCDWTYGLLPFLIVKNLNMNRRTKLVTCLVLVLGNISSVTTLIRFQAISEIATSSDFLFATTDLAIWSTSEVGIAIAAVSLVTVRPLFRRLLGRNSGAYASDGYGPRGGGGQRPSRADFRSMGSLGPDIGLSSMKQQEEEGFDDGNMEHGRLSPRGHAREVDADSKMMGSRGDGSVSDDGSWPSKRDVQVTCKQESPRHVV